MVSDCYPGNSTVLRPGANISIAGSGTVADPFVISASEVETGDQMYSVPVQADPSINLFNLAVPTLVRVTLEADATLSLPSNWGFSAAGSIILVITQGSGGSHAIDFASAGALTPGGTPVALSSTVGSVDVVRLLWTGDAWIVTDTTLDVG